MPLTRKVLLALALGLLGGVAISQLQNAQLIAAVSWVEPVGSIWISAIRMTVIPLVVAALIVAVASAPDPRLIGRMGGLAVLIFVVLLSATATLTVLVATPLLGSLEIDAAAIAALRDAASTTGAAAAQTQVPSFMQWLVALIPVNPFRAAADGALLPLIVFSVALGAALLTLGQEAREPLLRFARAVSEAMLQLMRWILELAPIGVFALALPLAVRLGVSAASAVIFYIALVSGLCIATGLALYPIAVFFGRVPLGRFARGLVAAQAVAASSRSSLASLPAMLDGAERIIGLPTAVTRFFIPLGASTFRITAVIVQIVGVLFLARLYGIELSSVTVLTVGLTSVLTSFSVPAVAGGSLIVMVPVLVAAGVPPEGVGILLGVDAIPDIFRTATNVTSHVAGASVMRRLMGLPELPLAAQPGAADA